VPEALSMAPGPRSLTPRPVESKWAPTMTREVGEEEPGMRTMMEGWLNLACGNWETVMAELGAATVLTVSKSQVAAWVPYSVL